MKMRINMFLLLCTLVMVFCLSACSPNGVKIEAGDASVEVGDDGVSVQAGDSSLKVESDGSVTVNTEDPDKSSSNNSSSDNSLDKGTENYTLPDVLIPSGATNIIKDTGSLTFTCNTPFQELLNFYKSALNTLSAKESSSSLVGSVWSYEGTYDNGKNISISIVGGQVTIAY